MTTSRTLHRRTDPATSAAAAEAILAHIPTVREKVEMFAKDKDYA